MAPVMAFTILFVAIGCLASIIEDMDQRLASIRHLLGRTRVKPQVFGWKVIKLREFFLEWEPGKLEDLKLPVKNDKQPEQVINPVSLSFSPFARSDFKT